MQYPICDIHGFFTVRVQFSPIEQIIFTLMLRCLCPVFLVCLYPLKPLRPARNTVCKSKTRKRENHAQASHEPFEGGVRFPWLTAGMVAASIALSQNGLQHISRRLDVPNERFLKAWFPRSRLQFSTTRGTTLVRHLDIHGAHGGSRNRCVLTPKD